MHELHTTPFIAEVGVLIAQSLRVLPFAVKVEDGVLPAAEEIRECTNRWTHNSRPPGVVQDAHRADFVLVSCNMDVYISEQHGYKDMTYVKKLRQALTHPKLPEKVKRAVHIVTTWKWSIAEEKASFWLRGDVLKAMMKNQDMYGWRVEIWRIDSWLAPNVFRPFMSKFGMDSRKEMVEVIKAAC